MSGRRSFSATVISRSNSENTAPSRTPGSTRKGASIANALSGPGRPRRSLDSVLGNGSIANRRGSEGATPNAKQGGKGSRTVVKFDDSDANKENIAPMRLVSLTAPSPPSRRHQPKRFYSDSFQRSVSLSSADNGSPRVHVIKLASLDVEDSDVESKHSSAKKIMREPVASSTAPPRLTKTTIATLEKNGKVLLRVERDVQDTDSSDSENSECDSDSGLEDHEGGWPNDKARGTCEGVTVESNGSHVSEKEGEADVVQPLC